MSNYLALLVLVTVATTPPSSGQIQLLCKLSWQDFSIGDPLPPGAIALQADLLYVARVKHNNRYYIGTMEKDSGLAHFEMGVYSSYQILMNPNKCQIRWLNGRGTFGPIKPPLGAQSGEGSNYFIGRGSLNNVWFGGTVNTGNSQIKLSRVWIEYYSYRECWWIFCWSEDAWRLSNTLSDYEILTSFSPGLSLEILDFKLQEDDAPLEDLAFLGMDDISNLGEGDVAQTITHTKRMSESFSVTHSESTTESHTASVSVSASFFGVGMEASYSYENSQTTEDSQTLENTKETELTVSREISVPSGTEVQACSTVKISENFVRDYSAIGLYRGVGMSAQEVDQVLRKFGVVGEPVGKDAIMVQITGQVSAQWAMNTMFNVVPSDSMKSCSLIKADSYRREREREARWRLMRESRRNATMKRKTERIGKGPIILTYKVDEAEGDRRPNIGTTISVKAYRQMAEAKVRNTIGVVSDGGSKVVKELSKETGKRTAATVLSHRPKVLKRRT